MTSLVTIVAPFGDGEYAFGLHIGQWEPLQELTKIGPGQLWFAFASQAYMARWPREVIRLGLIGEGMDPVKAENLVRTYCDDHPFNEFAPLALAIITKAMERPKTAKKNETEDRPNGETTISSTLPSSMATVQ